MSVLVFFRSLKKRSVLTDDTWRTGSASASASSKKGQVPTLVFFLLRSTMSATLLQAAYPKKCDDITLAPLELMRGVAFVLTWVSDAMTKERKKRRETRKMER